MSLAAVYKNSLRNKWVVRFKTKHPHKDCYDGIVVKNEDNFIIIARFDNFEFNGITILTKRFISGYRNGDFENCANKIIRLNGHFKKVKIPAWLNDCEILEDVFKNLKKRKVWPGVEILFDNAKDSAFYIGPILGGNSQGFWLHCYDAAGEWEKEYFLSFKEVLKVDITDKYCDHFNKFMKSKKRSRTPAAG